MLVWLELLHADATGRKVVSATPEGLRLLLKVVSVVMGHLENRHVVTVFIHLKDYNFA